MMTSEINTSLSGIKAECFIRKRIKQHLIECLNKSEYINYPHCNLITDYTAKIKKIEDFLQKFDK